MLTTIAVILILLWALGLIGGQTFGGLLHLVLVVAIVLVAWRLLTGRSLS